MLSSLRTSSESFPMAALAALSVVLLVVAALWQATAGSRMSAENNIREDRVASTTDDAWSLSTSSSDGLTPLGTEVLSRIALAYQDLESTGTYTPEAGEAAAKAIAPSVRPVVSSYVYTAADITTTADASRSRLAAYRADLQNALKPLLDNKSYELSTYANYIATKDPADLASLQASALNYHTAVLNAARITVPESAVAVHLEILNALDAFGATLATQIGSVSDPYASAALLSTYNAAETEVFLSFDALARFFRDKIGA